ncbi:MAG: hypothetical protein A3J83_07685 [Elusimicrobia bacterium RIFOXYA2_FULL_40_6]|nr:MAG: hypothetical protein A3J83_07685 [Elusimicrobia bacterium RIFOXYA2_FULL_40_6]
MNLRPVRFILFIAAFTAIAHAGFDPEKYIGMVFIPSGHSVIGTNDGFEQEKPRHVVYIKGYFMDKYEVTNKQYKIFIDATKRAAPFHWVNGEYLRNTENYPVTNVTYFDAAAYSAWAGKRLPTEEEWEKASRGRNARIYPWGNEWEWNCGNVKSFMEIFDGLKPIGSFPMGKGEYGNYDLSGNAKEWTDSWYAPYQGTFPPNKKKLENKFKIVRGGSYKTTKGMSQSFRRDMLEPADFSEDLGFRCVKDE